MELCLTVNEEANLNPGKKENIKHKCKIEYCITHQYTLLCEISKELRDMFGIVICFDRCA